MFQIFSKKAKLDAIYSNREFSKIINIECDRADRYGQRLSLALIEVGNSRDNTLIVRQLVRSLHLRFRNIDELGWYSVSQIGVILPYTPSEGAWNVAKDVCESISNISSPPPFTIYSYPSKLWPVSKKKRLLENINPLNSVFKSKNSLIMTIREFNTALSREIDRADRHSHIFSILIIDMGEIDSNKKSSKYFLHDLNRRIRDSDEIGWYDRKRVGVILPYTNTENTQRIVNELKSENDLAANNIFSFYTYPNNWNLEKTDKSHFEPKIIINDEPKEKQDPNNSELSEQEKLKNGEHLSELSFGMKLPLWKRIIDIFGSLIGIFIFFVLYCVIGIVIKIVSPGPVLFRQKRLGYRQKEFNLIKFRTMHVGSDEGYHYQEFMNWIANSENEPMLKSTNDHRIFSFGRFLRNSYIDELPQFINVLRGEMSIVGPRPCIPYEAKEYHQWHKKRFLIKPGLTGLWQVSGKNKRTFKEMIRMDLAYQNEMSFWVDILIIIKTIPVIIKYLFSANKE